MNIQASCKESSIVGGESHKKIKQTEATRRQKRNGKAATPGWLACWPHLKVVSVAIVSVSSESG